MSLLNMKCLQRDLEESNSMQKKATMEQSVLGEPVVKPETILELGPADIKQLKLIVGKVSEDVWNLENEGKENDFFCFHHTRHIIFRFIEGMRDHQVFYSNPIWNVWKGMLLPIMNELVKPYGFKEPVFPKAMLARLAAGHVIDMHVDGAGANLHTHKIHVPLQTNEKALFHINEESFHLKEGFGYEVNNIVRHGVENKGDEDRIHLIFEVYDAAT